MRQGAGLALALSGRVAMLLPGLSAPPLAGSLLMLLAGTAWGVYSLLGRRVADPAAATTGNFLRAAPLSCLFSLLMMARLHLDPAGALYAVLSGVFASGIGYVIWYAALRGLSATGAASVQLSVPLLAALGGIVFLDESITLRLAVSCVAILGGIAMVVLKRRAVALTKAFWRRFIVKGECRGASYVFLTSSPPFGLVPTPNCLPLSPRKNSRLTNTACPRCGL